MSSIKYEQKTAKFVRSQKSGGRDESGKRYQCYAWFIDDNKITSISKKKIDVTTRNFIEACSSRPVRVGYDDKNNIIELYLLDQNGSFVLLDTDIINYKSKMYTSGFSLLSSSNISFNNVLNNSIKSSDLNKLEGIVDKIGEKFQPKVKKQAIINNKFVSIETKTKNVSNFINDIFNNKSEVISKLFNDSEFKVNVLNNGGIIFNVNILAGSSLDVEVNNIVNKIDKKKVINITSVDGELPFAVFMNRIFSHLQLDTRVYVDESTYSNMGDDGDLRVSSYRLDIKVRQKYNAHNMCHLLINEETLDKGFNFFIYAIREGDRDKNGEDRRVNFYGYITNDDAKNGFKAFIKPRNRKGHWTRQFTISQVRPFNDLIAKLVLAALKKETYDADS